MYMASSKGNFRDVVSPCSIYTSCSRRARMGVWRIARAGASTELNCPRLITELPCLRLCRPGLDAVSFARTVVDWVVRVFVFAYASQNEPARTKTPV